MSSPQLKAILVSRDLPRYPIGTSPLSGKMAQHLADLAGVDYPKGFVAAFDRVNLTPVLPGGPGGSIASTSMTALPCDRDDAKARAKRLLEEHPHGVFVLLGWFACEAFGVGWLSIGRWTVLGDGCAGPIITWLSLPGTPDMELLGPRVLREAMDFANWDGLTPGDTRSIRLQFRIRNPPPCSFREGSVAVGAPPGASRQRSRGR